MIECLLYKQVCDAEGCDRQRTVIPDSARSGGWTVTTDDSGARKDFCPEHSNERHELER